MAVYGDDNFINRGRAEAITPEETAITGIIDGTRKSSIAMQLMRRLPNMTTKIGKMSVLDMLPIADFVDGDAGMKITTKMAWAKKQIVVGEIAAIIPIAQAVLDDAAYDIWGQARPALVESFSRVFDNQVFNGGNPKAPTQWPEGLIPQAIAAGQAVTMGTGVDVLDDLNSVFALLDENEYDLTGLASQRILRSKLRGLRNTQNDFIFATPVSGSEQNPFGVPIHFVGRGTWDRGQAIAIAGDWDNAVYSIRQDMTFEVFRTGVISDDDGRVIINLLQQDMVALRAVIRLGWQVVNAIDIDRDRNAFPFAVLLPSAVGASAALSDSGGEGN